MILRSSRSNPTSVLLFLLVVSVFLWWMGVRHWGVEKFSSSVTALGILVGGSWTLYQFVLRRAFESALLIECAVRTERANVGFVVFVDVVLENIGNRRITAPRELTLEQIEAYGNSVAYPADLQIKRLSDDLQGARFAGWWSTKSALEEIRGIPKHIPLLYEYTTEKITKSGDVDFFMEPSEKYHLGTVFVLTKGCYVAKVVFVGERAKAAEYWSRIVCFSVPALQAAATSSTSA